MARGYEPTPEQKAARAAELAQLRERLNARVDTEVPKLFPAARRAGNFWEVGGLDGHPGQSLKINRSGMVGYWTNFKESQGSPHRSGSILDLVVLKQYGGNFGAAMKALRESEGLVNISPEQRRKFEAEAKAQAGKAQRESREAEERKHSRAQALWHGAVPIHGTPAEAYLQGRVPSWRKLEVWPGSLRYRPDVGCSIRSHYPDWQGYPALLAGVFAPDGQLVACHRTYLDISGWDHAAKRGKVTVHKVARLHDREAPPFVLDPANPPAPDSVRKLKSHKATLGRYQDFGACIPLRKGRFGPDGRGRRLKDLPQGAVPCFSEGIEDALNYAVDHPDKWIGAAVSLANMAQVWVPPQAGGICFLADRDPADNESAQDSFESAVAAQQARRDDPEFVMAEWPLPGFKDFSDQATGNRM